MAWNAVTDPMQNIEDLVTGTFFIEQAAGFYGTIVAGGDTDLTDCPSMGTCVTVNEVPKKAIVLGHTLLIDQPLSLERAVHEQQHIIDIEVLGGIPFYARYGAESLLRWALDDDPYKDNSAEVRADEAGVSWLNSLRVTRWPLNSKDPIAFH